MKKTFEWFKKRDLGDIIFIIFFVVVISGTIVAYIGLWLSDDTADTTPALSDTSVAAFDAGTFPGSTTPNMWFTNQQGEIVTRLEDGQQYTAHFQFTTNRTYGDLHLWLDQGLLSNGLVINPTDKTVQLHILLADDVELDSYYSLTKSFMPICDYAVAYHFISGTAELDFLDGTLPRAVKDADLFVLGVNLAQACPSGYLPKNTSVRLTFGLRVDRVDAATSPENAGAVTGTGVTVVEPSTEEPKQPADPSYKDPSAYAPDDSPGDNPAPAIPDESIPLDSAGMQEVTGGAEEAGDQLGFPVTILMIIFGFLAADAILHNSKTTVAILKPVFFLIELVLVKPFTAIWDLATRRNRKTVYVDGWEDTDCDPEGHGYGARGGCYDDDPDDPGGGDGPSDEGPNAPNDPDDPPSGPEGDDGDNDGAEEPHGDDPALVPKYHDACRFVDGLMAKLVDDYFRPVEDGAQSALIFTIGWADFQQLCKQYERAYLGAGDQEAPVELSDDDRRGLYETFCELARERYCSYAIGEAILNFHVKYNDHVGFHYAVDHKHRHGDSLTTQTPFVPSIRKSSVDPAVQYNALADVMGKLAGEMQDDLASGSEPHLILAHGKPSPTAPADDDIRLQLAQSQRKPGEPQGDSIELELAEAGVAPVTAEHAELAREDAPADAILPPDN